MADRKSVVICLTREGMGQAERELSLRLVSNFLHALEAERQMPAAICCYAEGVRLTVEGSPVLANLKMLEALGVPILVCRTCLDADAHRARCRGHHRHHGRHRCHPVRRR